MKIRLITGTCLLIVLAITIAFSSCQSEAQIQFERYYTAGQLTYQAKCQNCHGKNGEGLNALIPPLTDTIFIKNNKNRLACFLKNGLTERITVQNKLFDEAMPPTGLAPIEIARVLTFVTNSFGNKLGTINEDNLGKCK